MGYIPSVSNYLPDTEPRESVAVSAVIERSDSKARFVVAGVLSAIVPGAGHFLIQRRARGLVFISVFVALFLLYWLLRLPQTMYGAILPILAVLVLGIVSSVDAAYPAGRNQARPGQWWLALLIPAAILSASTHSNWELRVTGFRVFLVPSRSMAPTIPEYGRVMVDFHYYRDRAPRDGEIVVAMSPPSPGIYIAKRVIAVAGETIEVRGDDVFLNGKQITEPYVALEGDLPDVLQSAGPLTLPRGKLFLMGDNRHVSFDSRAAKFGLVDVSAVRGKILYEMPSSVTNIHWREAFKRFDTEPR